MKTYCRQEISRGDIYYADLRPVIGSEQGGIGMMGAEDETGEEICTGMMM